MNPVYLHRDLDTAAKVYLRRDAVRLTLQPPYDGPFPWSSAVPSTSLCVSMVRTRLSPLIVLSLPICLIDLLRCASSAFRYKCSILYFFPVFFDFLSFTWLFPHCGSMTLDSDMKSHQQLSFPISIFIMQVSFSSWSYIWFVSYPALCYPFTHSRHSTPLSVAMYTPYVTSHYLHATHDTMLC